MSIKPFYENGQADEIIEFSDVDSSTIEAMTNYQKALSENRMSDADTILENNPELKNCIINATKLNEIQRRLQYTQEYALSLKSQANISDDFPWNSDESEGQLVGSLWFMRNNNGTFMKFIRVAKSETNEQSDWQMDGIIFPEYELGYSQKDHNIELKLTDVNYNKTSSIDLPIASKTEHGFMSKVDRIKMDCFSINEIAKILSFKTENIKTFNFNNVNVTNLDKINTSTINASNINVSANIKTNRFQANEITPNTNNNYGALSFDEYGVHLLNGLYGLRIYEQNTVLTGLQRLDLTGGSDTDDVKYTTLYLTKGEFCPEGDGTIKLGNASHRFNQLYCTKSPTTTSDRREKENIADTSDKYEVMFENLKPSTFKFKEGDRTHSGFIAQDVKSAMLKAGLEDTDFGGYCKDTVIDEEGMEVSKYGLRYEEFIALNTHMIQKLMSEIKDLKEEIKELKGGAN